MVLLTALGVDEATIRADYLRNNELTESLRAVIVEAMRRRRPELDAGGGAAGAGGPPRVPGRRATTRCAGCTGRSTAYLRDGLGVTDEVRAALRAHLLE